MQPCKCYLYPPFLFCLRWQLTQLMKAVSPEKKLQLAGVEPRTSWLKLIQLTTRPLPEPKHTHLMIERLFIFNWYDFQKSDSNRGQPSKKCVCFLCAVPTSPYLNLFYKFVLQMINRFGSSVWMGSEGKGKSKARRDSQISFVGCQNVPNMKKNNCGKIFFFCW